MADSRPIASVVRREWYIVLIAAILGVAVAFFMNSKAPTTKFTASQRVTVVGLASNLSNPPKAEALLAAATLSGVRRTAEESLGVNPGALAGQVSVELDKSDKTTVIVKASGPSEAEAEARVKAISAAASEQVMRPLQTYIKIQGDAAAQMQARIDELKVRVAKLEKQAAKAPTSQQPFYEQALAATLDQQFKSQDDLRQFTANKTQAENVMVADRPSVTKVSTSGVSTSRLLQGLLLGLVAGVAIAALREWMLSRKSGATS